MSCPVCPPPPPVDRTVWTFDGLPKNWRGTSHPQLPLHCFSCWCTEGTAKLKKQSSWVCTRVTSEQWDNWVRVHLQNISDSLAGGSSRNVICGGGLTARAQTCDVEKQNQRRRRAGSPRRGHRFNRKCCVTSSQRSVTRDVRWRWRQRHVLCCTHACAGNVQRSSNV